MEVLPLISARIIRPGDSIPKSFVQALRKGKHQLRNKDIVAVASKAVAVAERRIVRLSDISPGRRARQLSKRFRLTPQFAQLVADESDEIYGGVEGALLTLKNGEATANAGADQKNAPKGSAVLWPSRPACSANKIRKSLERQFRVKIGVIIVDSRVTPMRLGTVGLALASSGIFPIADLRGKKDLYGRKTRITLHAISDDIASAAHLVMGEGVERVPFVIVRGTPAKLTNSAKAPHLEAKDCLFMSQIVSKSGP